MVEIVEAFPERDARLYAARASRLLTVLVVLLVMDSGEVEEGSGDDGR